MKQKNPRNRTAFDPPICLTDNGRQICVSVGLPGITEEQIRIDLEKTTFTVSVSGDGTTVKKAIRIPKGVRIFKKKFADGVLEICLEKPIT